METHTHILSLSHRYTEKYTYTPTHTCIYMHTHTTVFSVFTSFFLLSWPPFILHTSPLSFLLSLYNHRKQSPRGGTLSHQVCLGLIKSFLSRAVRGVTFKDLALGFGPGKGISSLFWSLASCLIPLPSPPTHPSFRMKLSKAK